VHSHDFSKENEGRLEHVQSKRIFGRGRQVPKATVVVLVVVSSLKIPKAFLIRSRAQRNFAHTFVLTFPTDLPSQIFHLFSN